jgi:spore germination protein GerM
MNRRTVLRLIATGAALTALAGCGIPTDSQPRDVAEPDQPFAIRGPDAAAQSGSSDTDPVVYFLTPRPNERLIGAHRPVNSGADDLMGALLGKLTTEEMKLNWRTAIPPNVKLIGTAQAGPETILVKLEAPKDGANFLQGEDGVRVAAQIVYTIARGVPGAKAVQVEVNGDLQKLLDEEGTVLNRPAVEADYRSYDPDGSPDSTTTTR